MICSHCHFKTYNRQICEWCYQNPMKTEPKTEQEEDDINDQIDEAKESIHHNHRG